VERAVSLPVVHIADATGARVIAAGLRSVGLLGTLPTMERHFYRRRLEAMGLEVVVPDDGGRHFVNRAIYDELVLGRLLADTKAGFLAVVRQLRARGAQGIVLGCTEIPLLLQQPDCDVPLFDTLAIHARAGADFLLG
jgi:aspartate racemase